MPSFDISFNVESGIDDALRLAVPARGLRVRGAAACSAVTDTTAHDTIPWIHYDSSYFMTPTIRSARKLLR